MSGRSSSTETVSELPKVTVAIASYLLSISLQHSYLNSPQLLCALMICDDLNDLYPAADPTVTAISQKDASRHIYLVSEIDFVTHPSIHLWLAA